MNENKKNKINLVCTPMSFYSIKLLLGLNPLYNRTLFPNSYLRLYGSFDNPLIPAITRNYSKLDVNFCKKDKNFNPNPIKIEYKSVATQTDYKCVLSNINCDMDESEWIFIKDE